jgi:prophage DNA circulation protein
MSYKDRLRQSIQLISPDGSVFTALWIGNESQQAKKVGIFNYPGVDGSTVQDLGTSSTTYPLTLRFVGDDNDLEAIAFMSAMKEKGVWDIVHPVLGLLKLQPLSFVPDWQPVTSGGITEIETEWIEPLIEGALPSTAELQATVAAQILALNSTASDQLDNSTFQTTAADVAEFRGSTLDVVSNVESYLESISDGSATITAEMESIKRDIDAVLAVVPLDVIAVAGQLQSLIQLPALAIRDTQARLDAYSKFASGIGLMSPDTVGTPSYNRVALQELALTATFGAVADISSTGDLLSRVEAVEVIDGNLTLFNDATNTLDATQELFEDESIDKQYFSQSQSYPVSAELNALTVAYLLRAAFDLKVEKRFVLTRRRNPAMVAMEEYGGPGEGDANLEFFNDTNKIQGNEFLMMSVGRELVVYV